MSPETRSTAGPAFGIDEFVTCRPQLSSELFECCRVRGLSGIEVFMDDVRPRTLPLFSGEEGRAELTDRLARAGVGRIHASYWASPTSFLMQVDYAEVVGRFETVERLRDYYGDGTGAHIFSRWADEYALARDLGARAFVFHLIDYHPVDGAWEFTIPRATIVEAMAAMTQRLLRELDERELLGPDAPVIELENAGWGLEFGAQTADDFVGVLEKVWDPHGLLRIGWDLNHLLHAIGEQGGAGAFLLPPDEVTPLMRRIENAAEGDVRRLAELWIEANVADPRLSTRVSGIHLSDCPPKQVEYFRNGILDPSHAAGDTWDERRSHGLELVLDHYDNHVPLGDGVLDPVAVRGLLESLAARHPIMLLHELKNSDRPWEDLDLQRHRLWGT